MGKRFRIFTFLACFGSVLNAQIPNMNSSDRLDVATWNLEWFGSASNGPTDNERQLQYATDLINTLNLDIIALQEVSDVAYWNRLLFNCPNYIGVLSTWSQTQKTAVLFKKTEFEFLYQKHILANFDYDFGSGRLPLEVGLIPKNAKWAADDTLRIWVLHMKANTGSSSQKVLAYNRRYNAGVGLKMYIDQLGGTNKGLVMGDWNDDFDQSILSGYATPYQNWMKDTQYAVTSYPLSVAKERSTVGYSDMIDHIACTPGMKSHWIRDSSSVLYADKWISNYGNVVSDHFPVFSRFSWHVENLNVDFEPTKPVEFKITRNAGCVGFYLSKEENNHLSSLKIYDLSGRLLYHLDDNVFCSGSINQWYYYEFRDANKATVYSGIFQLMPDGTVAYR
jgi:endonuclease/exonuclease/phosphatase family metal-dependent hydrolase